MPDPTNPETNPETNPADPGELQPLPERPAVKLDLFAVATHCIQTLTLYDADENDCGVAELHSTAAEGGERWHCECRAGGNVFVKQAGSFDEALAYLKAKRDELLPGGFIVAFAEFQIDPTD